MTDGDESRKEVSSPMTDLLAPKRTVRLGCWNVRTLHQTGKLAQATHELNRYNLSVLGMSEVRWTGTGQRKLAGGETILWSGRQDGLHYGGVALLTNRKTSNTLLQWRAVNERLLYARFNSSYCKLSIVVAYAPTEDALTEEKDKFYDAVQSILRTIPRHDLLVIMGDFNARTGNVNTGRERVMGVHGVGQQNDNGERLIEFCQQNDLVIGGTIFPHKNIHKITWTSPDGRTQSQIDHLLINGKWRRSLQDVRVMRGADIGSDHYLIVGTICLKLRRATVGRHPIRRLNVERLNEDATRTAFHNALREELSARKEILTIDDFNRTLTAVGEEVLGYKERSKSSWISSHTWQLIEERKDIKKRMLSEKLPNRMNVISEEYRAKDKEVKRSARKDKRQFVENLTKQAEEACRVNDMRTLYQITRKLTGNRRYAGNQQVRGRGGDLICDVEGELTRWREHFELLLNRPLQSQQIDIPEAIEDLNISTDPITLHEVQFAIQKLKNGKAPGDDGVYAEMLKVESEETPRILHALFQHIWEKEQIPEAWRLGTIIKLPKKGDLSDCTNWRGITLLSVTSKVFCRIILQRISGAVESILRQEQAGFRKGKSCTDQIFILRQIMEQTNEWNTELCVAYIDFQKAFDSVDRSVLWKILRHYGIPAKLVNLIKAFYEKFECQVAHNGLLTERFEVRTGVRQGCILSPLLFSLVIDWIMNQVEGRTPGIPWTSTRTLEDLEYADDVVLLARKTSDIQNKSEMLATVGKAVGLHINTEKSEVMRMNVPDQPPVMVYGQPLSEVTDTVYLGSKLTVDGDCENEITRRIGKASQAFCMLNSIWKSPAISTNTKIRLFKSNVLSVLLYASECWKTTAAIERRLNVFQTKCLRRILRIFWPNTISNAELLRKTGLEAVSTEVKRRRWRWLGHVCRMDPSSHARIAMNWRPEGKRKRGRPKETWRRAVERELRQHGFTMQTAAEAAADRKGWRLVVNASCATGHEED